MLSGATKELQRLRVRRLHGKSSVRSFFGQCGYISGTLWGVGRMSRRNPDLDGCFRHVQITSSGRFRDGKFVSTRCFTVDVTEVKRNEELGQNAEPYWRAVLDVLTTAIYITDAAGKITYYNEAAVELSGRRPELSADKWCMNWRHFNLDGTLLPFD